ncbi:MAG: hypothetical protein PHQ86_03540 [Dehalococcoidales bacterium]|nr:hypothetical protein [Dehalococcoidales bacterium]
MSGKTSDEIHNIIITPRTCKQWTRFINDVSPIATEQRQSSKWARRVFWISFISLIAILITWALTQFGLK